MRVLPVIIHFSHIYKEIHENLPLIRPKKGQNCHQFPFPTSPFKKILNHKLWQYTSVPSIIDYMEFMNLITMD